MQVSIQAAMTKLSELIEAVECAERVVITCHGAPVAGLIPVRKAGIRLGGLKSLVAPAPEGAFAPLDKDDLRDWGAL
jgi:prevent-host-death family protein